MFQVGGDASLLAVAGVAHRVGELSCAMQLASRYPSKQLQLAAGCLMLPRTI